MPPQWLIFAIIVGSLYGAVTLIRDLAWWAVDTVRWVRRRAARRAGATDVAL